MLTVRCGRLRGRRRRRVEPRGLSEPRRGVSRLRNSDLRNSDLRNSDLRNSDGGRRGTHFTRAAQHRRRSAVTSGGRAVARFALWALRRRRRIAGRGLRGSGRFSDVGLGPGVARGTGQSGAHAKRRSQHPDPTDIAGIVQDRLLNPLGMGMVISGVMVLGGPAGRPLRTNSAQHGVSRWPGPGYRVDQRARLGMNNFPRHRQRCRASFRTAGPISWPRSRHSIPHLRPRSRPTPVDHRCRQPKSAAVQAWPVYGATAPTV